MCKPLEDGGLGIKDIKKFNCALLAKWKWRLASEERGNWKDILISKYGSDLSPCHIPKKYLSWWWRDLSRACGEGVEDGWFKQALVWRVGSGDKVRFWDDAWMGSCKLISLYPMLFSISLDQRLTIGEVGE